MYGRLTAFLLTDDGRRGNQCQAYAQRYLQAALASVNDTGELASRIETVGAVPGALLPLLRTQQGYEQGINYTGSLSFAGSWRPYNETAESMGSDPTGNEADAGRVTFQGDAVRVVSRPSARCSLNSALQVPRALTGQLATSAAQWAPDVLVERSRAARARNETVTLVAIGPLTNVALALARDPAFAQGVELFYQGGSACQSAAPAARSLTRLARRLLELQPRVALERAQQRHVSRLAQREGGPLTPLQLQ